MNEQKIRSLTLAGYKSIREAKVEFGDITVLLGANGAGKSNFTSFFHLLNYLSTEALQEYISRNGGSDALLYYGRQTTPQLQIEMEFANNDARTHYVVQLEDAATDRLIFSDERIIFHREGHSQSQDISLGTGHKESRLKAKAQAGAQTCQVLRSILGGCRFYQFHDTSPTAYMRKSSYSENCHLLRSNAGNLAAYLYAMRDTDVECYQRIVEAVRQVFPAFGDFALTPSPRNQSTVLLNWREKGEAKHLFGPHQLSDGTLRFIALATLLLQPALKLPGVVILDEPELGLHPQALSLFARLAKAVEGQSQLILATQSAHLARALAPEQIVIVEADEAKGTQYKRLEPAELATWLETYAPQ